jgi:hypothetical protein
MCPSISPALVNPLWNADVNRAASLSVRAYEGASKVIRGTLSQITLTRDLWKLDSLLASLLETFYNAAEKPMSPPEVQHEIRKTLAALRSICDQCDGLYNTAKSRGLTNRRLMGPALNSIHVRSEELFDIIEAVEISLDSSGVDAIFDEALAELQSGATVKISDL